MQSQSHDKSAAATGSVAQRALQRQCDCGQHTFGGGECSSCSGEREGRLKPSASSHNSVNGYGNEVPPIVHEVLRSPGQPLAPDMRAFFEPRFGHDFSRVRVHTDAKAAESARAVNALAYTVGRDVVFGASQYAPQATPGQRLLAHELTHVVQQGGQPVSMNAKLEIGPSDSHSEREADQAADVMADKGPGQPTGLKISRLTSGLSHLIHRAIRFRSKDPLTIDTWAPGTTVINGAKAEISHGTFAASAKVHAEADTAAELNNWEVGFLQTDRVTWSRTYWTRTNADKRGKFLERKLKVPSTPLRDHLNDAIVWSAPGEFKDVAAVAGGALSADIPISSGDGPSSKRVISGSDQTNDASDGTNNIFEYRQGDNFISFVSAHNSATDEWRHLELVYWSVQDSVDFAPDPAGGVKTARDDRSLGKSKRFKWSPAGDQPAIGGTRANAYANDAANTTVKRVQGWT
jgi:hypothetical protein